jgi:glutathione synthase/RimK-type ligase-like ATP-grasp enzyme
MEMNDLFKLWADECSKLLGGLDILGLDFLHSRKDDKYYILEVGLTRILKPTRMSEIDLLS